MLESNYDSYIQQIMIEAALGGKRSKRLKFESNHVRSTSSFLHFHDLFSLISCRRLRESDCTVRIASNGYLVIFSTQRDSRSVATGAKY